MLNFLLMSGRRNRKLKKKEQKREQPTLKYYRDDPFLNDLYYKTQTSHYAVGMLLLLSNAFLAFLQQNSSLHQMLWVTGLYFVGKGLIHLDTRRLLNDPVYYAKSLLRSIRLSAICAFLALGILLASVGFGRKIWVVLAHSGVSDSLSRWITNLLIYAVSGIVGNFCYDLVKQRFLPRLRVDRSRTP
jgi:hypothetical protein